MRKKYFGIERFAKGNLKEGETFSIDSGLGGSYLVEFVKWNDDDKGLWKVISIGIKHICFELSAKRMSAKLYILI